MGKRFIYLMLITVLILSYSCTSMKRYKSMAPSGYDSTLADISLFGSRLVSPGLVETGKSLWDLSADAQSQFIKILNIRYPDNEMFLNALGNVYLTDGEELLADDYVRKDLRLVFSVSRNREYKKADALCPPELSRSDRLEYIKISLTARDPFIRFTGWNMYSTEYGSIDIGDVSFSKSLDLSSSASLSGKKNSPDVSAETSSSISRKEDQSVRYRYIKLNGRLNDRMIEMEEEGTREIDLTGNIIADVSLEFDSTTEVVTRIRGLQDSSGGFNNPGKLIVEKYLVEVPGISKISDVIEADLRLDFVYRNVVKGGKTFPEWDDRVKYYEGTVRKPVVLFRDRNYVPGFCSIGTGQKGSKKSLVTLVKQTGEISPLIFMTYDEAADFYEWLVWFKVKNGDRPLKIGKYNLQFNDKDLTSDIINNESSFGIVPYYW